MATQDDRRGVGAPTSPLSGWFVVTGAVLILSLLAAFFVQARQYALLNQAVKGQDDYLVLNLFQLETEYLRLRERWRQAAGDPVRAREQLQLRYDIFVSRIGLVQTDRAQRVLSDSPEYGAAQRALRDFVDRGDLYLGQNAQAPFSNASMHALLIDLEALDEPIHQMLLAGAHRVAEQVTARNDTLAQHNRIGLALTAFLSALVGVFGFLALRRMRQLDESRRAMEAMANRLHDAREQALRASQVKSEFLTNMSHAIRTPFHGMLGMLTLLRETKLEQHQQELLRTAVDSADHLLSLLNDIVDLSKLESGALTLDVREVDLAALVREVERLMRAPASAKGLQLSAQIDSSLPPRLQLDGTRVRQVLYNLVANAIRFTDGGSVALRCRRVAPQGEREAMLEIEVADTGVGMDADTLSRLFERRLVMERSPTRPGAMRQGTGLGLEIAQRLTRLMGGDIAVESTPGLGSTFRVRVPMRVPPSALIEVPSAPPQQAAAAPQTRHVLVAEDNAVNRLYIGALLERMGHSAHFVENGLEALQAVQEHRFDIVLMDVHMPVMDGIDATGRGPSARHTGCSAADRGAHRRCLRRHAHALSRGGHGRRVGQAARPARARGAVPAPFRQRSWRAPRTRARTCTGRHCGVARRRGARAPGRADAPCRNGTSVRIDVEPGGRRHRTHAPRPARGRYRRTAPPVARPERRRAQSGLARPRRRRRSIERRRHQQCRPARARVAALRRNAGRHTRAVRDRTGPARLSYTTTGSGSSRMPKRP